MSKAGDFELFQQEFKKWQQKFGLTGYKIYFKHERLVDAFADMDVNLSGMIATVRLNSKLSKEEKPFKNIKQDAKHEALHLLVGRLTGNAHHHSSSAEIDESSEELVQKLEDLIPDY